MTSMRTTFLFEKEFEFSRAGQRLALQARRPPNRVIIHRGQQRIKVVSYQLCFRSVNMMEDRDFCLNLQFADAPRNRPCVGKTRYHCCNPRIPGILATIDLTCDNRKSTRTEDSELGQAHSGCIISGWESAPPQCSPTSTDTDF